MTGQSLHRINLGVFEGYEGQWVDIYNRRTFDTYIATVEALGQGTRAYVMARFKHYVAAWSFPGSPADPAAVGALDEDIGLHILEEAEQHYTEVRRSPEERKSDAGAAGEGA